MATWMALCTSCHRSLCPCCGDPSGRFPGHTLSPHRFPQMKKDIRSSVMPPKSRESLAPSSSLPSHTVSSLYGNYKPQAVRVSSWIGIEINVFFFELSPNTYPRCFILWDFSLKKKEQGSELIFLLSLSFSSPQPTEAPWDKLFLARFSRMVHQGATTYTRTDLPA